MNLLETSHYMTIDGWFNYEELYRYVVQRMPSGSRFVEIGAWLGRSTAFLAEEIARSGKKIELYVVDTWEGSVDEADHQEYVKDHGGSIYEIFLHNMARGGLLSYVVPLKMDSAESAKLFEDGSIDFVFIDAQHSYEAVKRDIIAWYPKVKMAGLLCGHDYYPGWDGVIQAVDELVGPEKTIVKTSWVHAKGKPVTGLQALLNENGIRPLF